MGDGETDRLLVTFEFGTNGIALGNIVEINLANGFVANNVDTGTSTLVDSVSGWLDTIVGDTVAFDCSLTEMIGVAGDI